QNQDESVRYAAGGLALERAGGGGDTPDRRLAAHTNRAIGPDGDRVTYVRAVLAGIGRVSQSRLVIGEAQLADENVDASAGRLLKRVRRGREVGRERVAGDVGVARRVRRQIVGDIASRTSQIG